MSELKVNEQLYRINRLDVIKQFHIARKVLPIFAGLAKIEDELRKALTPDPTPTPEAPTEESERSGLVNVITAMAPLADAIAAMPDKDAEDIIFRCMAAVSRQTGNAWAPLLAANGKSLMFDDVGLPQLLQLTGAVVQENLGGFLAFAQLGAPV